MLQILSDEHWALSSFHIVEMEMSEERTHTPWLQKMEIKEQRIIFYTEHLQYIHKILR